MKPETARTAAVLAVFAACLWLLRGVAAAIAWSALLAVSTWPLRQRLQHALGGNKPAAAALLTAAVVVLLLAPLAWLAWRGAMEAPVLLRVWTESREAGLPAPDWLGHLPLIGPWALRQWNAWIAQPGALADHLRGLATNLHFGTGRALVMEAGHRAMSVFFCVLVLFFLYLDGGRLAWQMESVLARQFGPVGVQTLRLALAAVRGTVNGQVLVGLALAAVMAVAYGVAGLPHPALWGLATGLAGIVPFGGVLMLAAVVAILVSLGSMHAALALAAFGAVAFFVADHVVRPIFIAGTAKLPVVLTLLGIVGGLEAFGVLGVFLGPTLMAVLTAVWRELTVQAEQPPAKPADASPPPQGPALDTPRSSP